MKKLGLIFILCLSNVTFGASKKCIKNNFDIVYSRIEANSAPTNNEVKIIEAEPADGPGEVFETCHSLNTFIGSYSLANSDSRCPAKLKIEADSNGRTLSLISPDRKFNLSGIGAGEANVALNLLTEKIWFTTKTTFRSPALIEESWTSITGKTQLTGFTRVERYHEKLVVEQKMFELNSSTNCEYYKN